MHTYPQTIDSSTEDTQEVMELITQDQWKQFCEASNLSTYETLLSECDENVTHLLSLIVKQHEVLESSIHTKEPEIKKGFYAVVDKLPSKIEGVEASIESDFISLKWTSKDSEDISKYHIMCDSFTESLDLVVEPQSVLNDDNYHCSTRIVGLKPWESYGFKVCAENVMGMGEWSNPIEVEMNKSPPPKPTEVAVEVPGNPDTKAKKVLLKVNEPFHDRHVEEYRITYHNGEMGTIVTHTKPVHQTYNSNFVLPFPESTFVNVQISLKNEYGWSVPSDILDCLITDLQPSEADWFTYTKNSLTSNSIELVWEEPATNYGIVESYEIEWWIPTQSKRTDHPDDDSITISNLHSDTDYRFRIYPITKFGKRGKASVILPIKTLK